MPLSPETQPIATRTRARVAAWAGQLNSRRRSVGAVTALALAGFGVTAVAIAPLSTASLEARLPEVRTLEEVVRPDGLDAQLEALAGQALQFDRSELTRTTDSADSLLRRLGASDAAASDFLRNDPLARRLLAGRGGKLVQAETDPSGGLLRLIARYPAEASEQRLTHFSRLSVERAGAGFRSRVETAALERTPRLAAGTIRLSLFGATDEAGIPDAVAMQLAEIFSSNVDFRRELRRGDSFQVVYEALAADGQAVPWNDGAGRVLAAEFVNAGRLHQAFWFDGTAGRGGYYGADGRSLRRSFLASPLEFSRVSSGFAMRLHPLQQRWQRHRGVDYAAPAGTAVRALGDGVVEMAGWHSGYGNVIQLRHADGRETLYAHLSRIAVRKGQRVEQGQSLGAVGSTGWATGPHLHFEFRVGGAQVDPMRMARAAESAPLDAALRPQFDNQARLLQARLQLAESLGSTRASAE